MNDDPLPPDAPGAAVLPCLFCGEPERASLFEIWGHEFMLETCCEGLHGMIAAGMEADPAWGRDFLRDLDLESITGHRLRRIADDSGAGLVLDWTLELEPIGFREAKAFIARYHAHCGAPAAWRFGIAVHNGPTLLGVATVGNPVARALCGKGILEVNRLCVRRDMPNRLRWNAASMLYGWCAREAKRRGWRKIITYTRVDEPGTSLTAAGWVREARVRGRGWHGQARARSNRNAWVDKIRWSKILAQPSRKEEHPKAENPEIRS